MNLTITFALTSIALAGAAYHCYKSNKPLRIKAREEAEAEANRKARDEEAGRERSRRDNVRKEAVEDFEFILSGRAAEAVGREYQSYDPRGDRFQRRFPETYKLLSLFKHHEFRTEDVLRHKKQIATLQKQVTDLQLQQQEILKALQLGQPVE